MSIRERCEELYERMPAYPIPEELHDTCLALIESFALDIRNEALDEAAQERFRITQGKCCCERLAVATNAKVSDD